MPGEKRTGGEEAEKKSVVWGEGTPTMENYSPNFCCKNKECSERGKEKTREMYELAVGVKKAPFFRESDKTHAVILECPSCFEKFWFHLSDDLAENFRSIKETLDEYK